MGKQEDELDENFIRENLIRNPYESDLQRAIQISLNECSSLNTASISSIPSNGISLEELLLTLKDVQEDESQPFQRRAIIHELRHDCYYISPTEELERATKEVDSLVYWGPVNAVLELSTEYLTPIHIKTIFSPLPDVIFETYKAALKDGCMAELDSRETIGILECLFGNARTSLLKTGDILRWLRHPVMYMNASDVPWGLVQLSGGPCGFLACLQGYIVQALLFESSPLPGWKDRFFPSKDTLRRVFAEVVAFLIAQVTHQDGSYRLCWIYSKDNSEFDSIYSMNDLSCSGTRQTYFNTVEEKEKLLNSIGMLARTFTHIKELTEFLYQYSAILFCGPRISGCLNLLCSLIYSRSTALIRSEDFEEDPQRSLLGLFGQCNQELLNLMLVGKATSNLFDGDRILGAEMASVGGESQEVVFLRGVPRRSLIGYLSEMEVLRYCQVGDYLKYPFYPIWVCGSSDHFTLVFSTKKAAAKISRLEYAAKIAEEIFESIVGEDDESGVMHGKYFSHLLDASGLSLDNTQIRQAKKELLQDSQMILRNDFVDWFVPLSAFSTHMTQLSAVEKSRLTDQTLKSFPVFHFDSQMIITENFSTRGPELRYMKIQLLGRSFEPTHDFIGRILTTRWPSPMRMVHHSGSDLRDALRKLLREHRHVREIAAPQRSSNLHIM